MKKGNKSLNKFFSDSIFIGSFLNYKNIKKSLIPEFCLIGRSNVGKSSLINSIIGSKKIARTSKTAGRTQTLNIYEINKKINLVDLPGYGYARISKFKKEEINELIEEYFFNRVNIKKIYLLLDCRIGLKELDINLLDMINEINKNFSLILTKTDKCSKKLINQQINSCYSILKNKFNSNEKLFISSNKNFYGIKDIQQDIYKLSKLQ
ncbi:MAG: putative GTP-binding protein EngB [Alphaproteobacteria bacterium MarineAlpha5_Bin9]|nr:MAG: putative GTP-binding protein EngB [Alphaproteobacteria bacterium MarineAlpha5_Bin9]|tara:strand:+ start:1826 stop:2449 length:624 start_codon:yes stop_codon:yes gene_type:complete